MSLIRARVVYHQLRLCCVFRLTPGYCFSKNAQACIQIMGKLFTDVTKFWFSTEINI